MDWLRDKRRSAARAIVSVVVATTVGVPYSAMAEEPARSPDPNAGGATVASESGFAGGSASTAEASPAADTGQAGADEAMAGPDSADELSDGGSQKDIECGTGFAQADRLPIEGSEPASESGEGSAEANMLAGDAAEESYEADNQETLQNLIDEIADGTRQNLPIEIKGSFELVGPVAVPALSSGYLAIFADAPVVLTASPAARHVVIEPQSEDRALYFRNIVLDGNGNGGGIELEQGTSSFYLNSTSDATVPPGFESPSLTIKNCTAIDGAALHAIDTALYVHDTSIVGNAAAERGGAVFLGTEAWMHLGSSSVSGNTAGDGGAVYASGAGQPAIEVYDSALEGNTANRNGGAVYAERYLEIVSSTLRGNVAHENGGAIALVSKDADFEASLTLAHANVFGNEASGLSGQGNGGAIYLYGDNADMLIDDSDTNSRATDIYNNTAKGSGGGVYVEGAGESGTASTTMATGSVRDNAAAGGQGGGLAFAGQYVSIALGPTHSFEPPVLEPRIYANHAQGSGGGIHVSYAEDVSVESYYGIIETNTSESEGGGIAVGQSASATLVLSGTAVNGNAAAGNGGGIAVNAHSSFIYPSAALDGSGSFVATSSVSNNRSGGNGGGVYSENPDSGDYHMLAMQMQGALIDDNVARGSGGGIYGAATSSATLHAAAGSEASSMSISRNIAGASGGGVYLASVQSSSFYGNGAALEGNTAGSEVARGDGGGVYLASNEGYATYGFSESSTQQKNAVSDNHAYGNGGGVYAVSGQQSYGQVEGVDIDGNVAEESGGGIYAKASYASLSMHGGWDPETGDPSRRSLSENRARNGFGGGIYLEGSQIENRFERIDARANVSHEDGGALYASGSAAGGDSSTSLDTSVAESSFEKNEAGGSGGAVYAARSGEAEGAWSSFAATSVRFSENAARAGSGGAVYLGKNVNNLSLHAAGSGSGPMEFAGNAAALDGGALCLEGGWQTGLVQQVVMSGNTAGRNGGAFAFGAMDDDQNATEMFVSSSSITDNAAGDSGGGVWTPYENLGHLTVDTEGQIEDTTVFSGNTASRELESVLLGNPGDIALHDERIHTRSFSERPESYDASGLPFRAADAVFEYGYNNYDISYRRATMVLYDGNGATGGAVPVDNRKYLPGDVAAVKAEHTLVREGCTFGGWSFKADGGEPVPVSIDMGDTDVTLYAIWVKNPDPVDPVDPTEPTDPGESTDPGTPGQLVGSNQPSGSASLKDSAAGLAKTGDALAAVGIAVATLGSLAAAIAAWSRSRRRMPE